MRLNNTAYIRKQNDGSYKIKAGFRVGGVEDLEVEADTLNDAKEKFVDLVFEEGGMSKEGFQFVMNPSD